MNKVQLVLLVLPNQEWKSYCGNVLKMPDSALLKPNEYYSRACFYFKVYFILEIDMVSNKDK